ncbi:hypothetical protein [Microbacterium galbinum]|uniref:Uncharacterized protein n=1 Tax=Microbacterium galbinum TaxID=2851646 RepID=A0ABY4IWR8_9MICO|nr:hypothetical protein [Microbacterium galbinum]UPL15923.1 hypothetical protein KV396_16240 [Microbacterium galbinum]
MTTSDQHGQGPLTRKQLREIRLTGSTPVITDEEAAAAPAQTREPDAVVEKPAVEKPAAQKPAAQKPAAQKPAEQKPAPVAEAPVAAKPAPVAEEAAAPASAAAPLTRRQARDQERVRTASVPVVEPEDATPLAPVEPPAQEPEPQEQPPADQTPIVSAVPEFSAPAAPAVSTDDDIDEDDAEVAITPVSAAGASATVGEMPLDAAAEEPQEDVDDVDAVLGLDQEPALSDTDDVLADVGDDDEVIAPDERPTVNPAFGASVIDKTQKPFAPSFDELLTVGDSSGSQHTSPSALIFTPSPGEGSLSGPVASTGEILVTGSYELPRGIGSQGHAHGVADGKDVDAVLIDGELPPASSPTPIAASSAVSTIKPAGEVIRPPAPEKGNKLMLILAIVAGGLALALGVVLVVAFTTNVF